MSQLPYDTFREMLASKYPNCGHALWEPSPGGLYDSVEVGDVGFIRQGCFHRLFNVLLPGNHPSHQNFGVPEHHQPLRLNAPNHIHRGIEGTDDFCSRHVSLSRGRDIHALGPDDDYQVTVSCPGRRGAMLSLPFPAQREDTVALGDFGRWIVKHIDVWFAYAENLGLGINRMQDIVLVTGRHCAKSWVNVAFSEGERDAEVSFGAQPSGVSGVNIERRLVRGDVVLKLGPSGENLPENQCIFIRGYRVVRIMKIWPRLRGRAGPASDVSGHEPEPESDKQLEALGTPANTNYQDPIHVLSQYIAERAPDCDMVLAHDDDLACIDGVKPPDNLQPDVWIERLRDAAPEVRQVQWCNESTPGAEVAVTKIATLSKGAFTIEQSMAITNEDPMRTDDIRALTPAASEAADAHTPSSPYQTLADLHLSLEDHAILASSPPPILNKSKAAVSGLHHKGGQDDPMSKLQQELERTREERDKYASQYRTLLAKLKNFRKRLGNKLKKDAEELGRREQQIAQLTTQNEDLLSKVEALQSEVLASNAESERASCELNAMRQEVSGESLQRELPPREARSELERAHTARDDWGAKAMVRLMLEATHRELPRAKEASERDAAAEAERANNSQAILEDFQSAKAHELQQEVSERETRLTDIAQPLAEYKHRALQAELQLEENSAENARRQALEQEVKEKSLLIGKLRHEAVITNEHLREALRRLCRGSADTRVDRRVVTNALLAFLCMPREDTKREILGLLASILSWSDEERACAGLQMGDNPASANSLALPRLLELEKTDETESFSRLWVEFLLAEAAPRDASSPPVKHTSIGHGHSPSTERLDLVTPPRRKGKERALEPT